MEVSNRHPQMPKGIKGVNSNILAVLSLIEARNDRFKAPVIGTFQHEETLLNERETRCISR